MGWSIRCRLAPSGGATLKFSALRIDGAYRIESEVIDDVRGAYVRQWDGREFASQGLQAEMRHLSVARNRHRGTLRGLHYQAAPFGENKLVRCVTGAIFDVIVDLRLHSPTYLRHESVELDAEEEYALWIPRGCAHGYQTLTDDARVEYLIDAPYSQECARGVRYDDPSLGIAWPLPVTCISPRDERLPHLVVNASQRDSH